MKLFVYIILLFAFSEKALCRQVTEFDAASFISLCAFGYYQEYGEMPETLCDLQKKEYSENTQDHLDVYSECGFEIFLQKKNTRRLDIYVNSKRMQCHLVYEVEAAHHFSEYLNGALIDEYYRSDSGYILDDPARLLFSGEAPEE
ncbi:MAG: hypothetical protein K6G18_01110 [Treponema sp.]|nr:hypothetical protein [Treponema sp.]